MKTILILTDLSKKAENAAFYAIQLAEKINAKTILCHSIPVNDLVFAQEVDDKPSQSEHNLINHDLDALNLLANILKRAAPHANIEVISQVGNLDASVNQLIHDRNIDLVVMGAKSDDPEAFYLFGSDAINVLEHVSCPILFIPDGSQFNKLDAIVFSNDLKNKYSKAVHFLTDIARVDNSEIIITHMGEELIYNEDKYLDIFKNEFNYNKVSIRLIPGENIQERLLEIINAVEADLIVMIYHEHKVLGKHVPGSNSEKMLYHHSIPLLILPD
jgi:nucleotide-binding universal stress UspA family protein